MRIRKSKINKYYDVFVNLKRDSDNGVSLIHKHIRDKYKVGSEFCTILKELKITEKKDGRIVWNERIKPSTRLATKVCIDTNAKIKRYNKVGNLEDSKTPVVKRTYTKRKVELPKVDKSKVESFSKKTEKQQRVFSIAWGLITIKY